MKKIMLFLSCISIISNLKAGVTLDTIVETPEGSKEIGILRVGDQIICLDKNLTPHTKIIEAIEEVEAESFIEIITEDDHVIHVSHDQQLFVPFKWIQTNQLSLGDLLLKRDRNFIKIKGICWKQESTKLRFITVEEHRNFLVSKNGILIHNGLGGATTGFLLGKVGTSVLGHGSIHAISWAVGLFCPPAGIAVDIALESALAVPIETLSLKVGVACGIALGVATGPA